jgi:hypothetical protein
MLAKRTAYHTLLCDSLAEAVIAAAFRVQRSELRSASQ